MNPHETRHEAPLDLESLGLHEVEERLEVSPLLTAGCGPEPLDREGHSCSCKVNDDRPEDDGGGGEGDG